MKKDNKNIGNYGETLVSNFLENNKEKKFSLVFLDPPYAKKEIYEEVMLFLKYRFLGPVWINQP